MYIVYYQPCCGAQTSQEPDACPQSPCQPVQEQSKGITAFSQILRGNFFPDLTRIFPIHCHQLVNMYSILHLQVILQQISALLPTDNKVTQVSIATLVLNYAVSATSDQDDQKSSNKIQGEVSLTVKLTCLTVFVPLLLKIYFCHFSV